MKFLSKYLLNKSGAFFGFSIVCLFVLCFACFLQIIDEYEGGNLFAEIGALIFYNVFFFPAGFMKHFLHAFEPDWIVGLIMLLLLIINGTAITVALNYFFIKVTAHLRNAKSKVNR